jgi:hypothetical protein
MKKGKKLFLLSLKRTRNIWMALGLSALPLAFLLIGLTSANMSYITKWAGRVFGFFFLGGGIFLIIKSISIWNCKKSTIFRLINSKSENIVWHYTLNKKDVRGGEMKNSTTLFIADINKNRYPVIVKMDHLSEILYWICKKAPNATDGWSKELNSQYRKNPENLLNKI